jgi:hypothetical protein
MKSPELEAWALMTPNLLKAQGLRVHPFIQYSMGLISNHCWFSKCAYSKRKKILWIVFQNEVFFQNQESLFF